MKHQATVEVVGVGTLTGFGATPEEAEASLNRRFDDLIEQYGMLSRRYQQEIDTRYASIQRHDRAIAELQSRRPKA